MGWIFVIEILFIRFLTISTYWIMFLSYMTVKL